MSEKSWYAFLSISGVKITIFRPKTGGKNIIFHKLIYNTSYRSTLTTIFQSLIVSIDYSEIQVTDI